MRKPLIQRQRSHYDPHVEGVTVWVTTLNPEFKEGVNKPDRDYCQ